MCIIAWNWQPESDSPLLLMGNRDEFYARPAEFLHWWEGEQILAGRDLQGGGTWLGVSRNGRLAALTNYRLPALDATPRPSRGELTTRFLQNNESATDYLRAVATTADQYNPFNLLVWDGQLLLGLESRHRRIVNLEPGIGAVSNADFNAPWPKVQQLKSGLKQQCNAGRITPAELLPLLQDRLTAPEEMLPDTGVPNEWERLLSATFITSSAYGTRASSIVQMNKEKSFFFEQSYNAHGISTSTLQHFNP